MYVCVFVLGPSLFCIIIGQVRYILDSTNASLDDNNTSDSMSCETRCNLIFNSFSDVLHSLPDFLHCCDLFLITIMCYILITN